MARTQPKKSRSRRVFSEEFKQEAVQMLLDGHSAPSVAERLELQGPIAFYHWKPETLRQAGPAARTLVGYKGDILVLRKIQKYVGHL